MKLIFRALIFFVAFITSVLGKASSNEMVILGADCSSSLQTGAALSSDPFGSKFVEMVEAGECSGIVYDTEEMPRWAAEAIISVDPSNTYFIQGEYSERYDAGTLDPIVLEADKGNNPFSIPWNWLVKFSGLADEEIYQKSYSVDDLPACDPNNLIIEYSKYSEIA